MNKVNIKNNLTVKKNTSVIFGLIAVAMLMVSPLTISESFAESKNGFEWQLIFIQETECLTTDNLNQVYSSLTAKYFEMYELENVSHEALCMTELEYSNYQMDESIDLIILVYDGKIGQKILHSNNVDGLYIHTGNDRTKNHMVIMCHCSDYETSYEQILPSWILTHELSHFVLSYKGYPRAVIQEAIHEIEHEYDNCVGTNFQDDYCNEFKATIRPDNTSEDFVVMAPYKAAVGQKLINLIPDDLDSSKIIDMQRNMAKMWTANEIDDGAYINTLKNFIDAPTSHEHIEHEPFLDIENGFVIAEKSKPKDIEWDEYLNPSSFNQTNPQLIMNHIPLNLNEPVDEMTINEMPNWFKSRALLWSEERISDKVFFDGVEHLVRMGIVNIN